MAQPMIEINNVSMRFNMAQEKVDSLKEAFIRRVKGTLRFQEFYALRDINIQVERGDVYGVVGLNGSGKSTLMKIVAGVMKPTTGSCKVHGTVAPLIELGAGFDPDLTARENIFLNATVLGMDPKYIEKHFDEIVDFAELHDFMDIAIKNYSSGMVSRLAFSVATIMKPDVLICDEILSVGDFLFKEKCARRMSELIADGTTVFLVSHEIGLIEKMCNKAVWLSHGRMVAQGDCLGVCNDYRENARAGAEIDECNTVVHEGETKNDPTKVLMKQVEEEDEDKEPLSYEEYLEKVQEEKEKKEKVKAAAKAAREEAAHAQKADEG